MVQPGRQFRHGQALRRGGGNQRQGRRGVALHHGYAIRPGQHVRQQRLWPVPDRFPGRQVPDDPRGTGHFSVLGLSVLRGTGLQRRPAADGDLHGRPRVRGPRGLDARFERISGHSHEQPRRWRRPIPARSSSGWPDPSRPAGPRRSSPRAPRPSLRPAIASAST